MKAFVFSREGGPEVAEFAEIARPTPGSGQVLVAVKAAGVNPADWKRRSGLSPAPPVDRPTPLGRELAGVVEELGSDVEGFKVGDAVFGATSSGDRSAGGSFAEYALLSVDQMARKPDDVSFLDAATLGIAGATAYDGIVQLDPKSGEILLIIGIGGGVGIAAAQIAIARGVRVIGTASPAKREFVQSVGAEHVAYGSSTVDEIRAIAPDGVDAIFDSVGGDAIRELVPLVRDPRRLVSAGDKETAEEVGGRQVDRKRTSEVLENVGRLVQCGTLNPSVTAVYPFEGAAEAMDVVESGHATGKVVLEFR